MAVGLRFLVLTAEDGVRLKCCKIKKILNTIGLGFNFI